MVYNNYTPQFYPPVHSTAMPTQRQPNVNVAYVQGENAAKAYPISAGQIMYLFDTENPVMYIKSTDQSGFPLPVRIFDYKERIQNEKENPKSKDEPKLDFISRDEFDKFREEIKNEIKRARRRVDEPTKENH